LQANIKYAGAHYLGCELFCIIKRHLTFIYDSGEGINPEISVWLLNWKITLTMLNMQLDVYVIHPFQSFVSSMF